MTGELVELALRDLAAGNIKQLRDALTELHPAQIAGLLEGMPPEQRRDTWDLVSEETRGDVMAHVNDEVRTALIDELAPADLVVAAEQMDDKDLADVIEDLPVDLTESVLSALDEDHRQRIEAVLSYPEGTAGRLMSTNVISVRSDVTLAVVLRWLRRHRELPPHTDALKVLSSDGCRWFRKLALSR
jgi:magnesium transporter